MNALAERIESLPVATLADVVRQLVADMRPECDAVYEAAIASLQRRMTCGEYLALCNDLDAALS